MPRLCCISVLLSLLSTSNATPAQAVGTNKPRTRVIISTDIAAGISGTNGDAGHLPYKPANSSFGVFGVQDPDDGLALLMALNSPELDVAAVIPTYGNAGLAPEMLVARLVLRELKNVPISQTVLAPGATGPLHTVFSRPAYYNMSSANGGEWDTQTVSIKRSFAASCPNWGV